MVRKRYTVTHEFRQNNHHGHMSVVRGLTSSPSYLCRSGTTSLSGAVPRRAKLDEMTGSEI